MYICQECARNKRYNTLKDVKNHDFIALQNAIRTIEYIERFNANRDDVNTIDESIMDEDYDGGLREIECDECNSLDIIEVPLLNEKDIFDYFKKEYDIILSYNKNNKIMYESTISEVL